MYSIQIIMIIESLYFSIACIHTDCHIILQLQGLIQLELGLTAVDELLRIMLLGWEFLKQLSRYIVDLC